MVYVGTYTRYSVGLRLMRNTRREREGLNLMFDYTYSLNVLRKLERAINAGQEAAEHAKRRPRATYYQTTKFYNFRKQKKTKAKV